MLVMSLVKHKENLGNPPQSLMDAMALLKLKVAAAR